MNRSATATPASSSVHPYRYATVLRWLKPIRDIRWWKWLASADQGARLYLSRFATTKPVSRNGTARRATHTNSVLWMNAADGALRLLTRRGERAVHSGRIVSARLA